MSSPDEKRQPYARIRLANALPDLLAGMPPSEVARKHGVSHSTVTRWYRTLDVDAAEDAIEKARDALHSHAPRAVEALSQALDSDDWKVRVMAANSVLDRAGIVKTERREVAGDSKAPLEVRITLAEATELARGED